MKKALLIFSLFAIALGFSANNLMAQEQEAQHRFTVEGRLGVMGIPSGGFLDISQGNHFSLGFLFAYRPVTTHGSFLDRLTLRGSLDGAGLGGQDVTTGVQDTERLYLMNFAVGIDAIRSPGLSLRSTEAAQFRVIILSSRSSLLSAGPLAAVDSWGHVTWEAACARALGIF